MSGGAASGVWGGDPVANAGGRESLSAEPLHVAGVLFDTGDVLYDATLWRRWLLQLLTRMGLHTHYRAFYCVWEREYLVEAHCGRGSIWDALREYLRSIGLTAAHVDEILCAGHARYAELVECVRPLPGVAATLAQLSACGFRLGALANSSVSAECLAEKLERLGLGGYLTAVVSSRDLSSAMPNPANYRAAMAALGLAPHESAFVGHDSRELSGARSAGMATIAVNYDFDAPADVHLDRIEALPACLDDPAGGASIAAG